VSAFAEASGIADFEGVAHAAGAFKDAAADHRPAACGNEAHHAGPRDAGGNLGAWPDPERSLSIEDMCSYIASEHLKWGAMVKHLGLEGSQ